MRPFASTSGEKIDIATRRKAILSQPQPDNHSNPADLLIGKHCKHCKQLANNWQTIGIGNWTKTP